MIPITKQNADEAPEDLGLRTLKARKDGLAGYVHQEHISRHDMCLDTIGAIVVFPVDHVESRAKLPYGPEIPPLLDMKKSELRISLHWPFN